MRIFYIPAFLASLAARYPKSCVLLATILTIFAGTLAVQVEIRNDFVDLLPKKMPEVRVIRNVLYKSGGLGYQAVLVESKSQAHNRAFLRQLRLELSGLFRAPDVLPFADAIQDQYERLGGILRDISQYGRNPSPYWKKQISGRIQHLSRAPMVEYAFDGYDLSFFERHQMLMLSKEDLREIFRRLERKISYEVKKQQLGDTSLLEPDEKPKDPGIDLSDIRRKYEKKLSSFPRRIEVKEKGRWYSALIIRPGGIATDLIFTRDFIARLKKTVQKLQASKPQYQDLTPRYVGGFTANLHEFRGITNDVKSSIYVTSILLLVLILLFFRRKRVLWLIPLPLGMGFAWTFAFVTLTIGHLNTATSNVPVLLLGLGIDYGIYLTHRYFQERMAGQDPLAAIRTTFVWTGKGVATAAATTAVGFFALILCRFRGFSDFGLIAGMGILLCLLAMSTVLPALLVLSERWPVKPVGDLVKLPTLHRGFPLAPLGVLLAVAVIIGAAFSMPKVGFETRMKKLSFKSGGIQQQNSHWRRFDKIFPQTAMNPVVFFTPDERLTRHVQSEVLRIRDEERKRRGKKAWLGIRRTLSAFQFVPPQQAEKMKLIRQIDQLLRKNRVGQWVDDDPKLEKVYRQYKTRLDIRPFGAQDLPLYLQRDLVLYDKDRFDKVSGYLVVIASGYDLSDGREAQKLHAQLGGVRPIAGATAATIQASGEPIIFARLLKVVSVDSFWAILLSLLAVSLLVMLDLRSFKLTLLSLWPLATGLLGVAILLVYFDLRLNLFNLVVLPALLGINIDAGVHMLHRYRESPSHGTLGVQLELMGAITMASLTTVISFASLLFAHHQGMQSVGQLAVAGLLIGLVAALVFLPSLMEVIFKAFPLTKSESEPHN